jgi:L-asparagine transporter-like permease
MKNKYLTEIIVSLVLIVLLLMIINPRNVFMPSMSQEMFTTATVVVFGFFASLILREQTKDEREDKHRGLAGRSAFLSGVTVLLCGIVIQVLNHNLDTWLVFTLVVMILIKIVNRIYYDMYQ